MDSQRKKHLATIIDPNEVKKALGVFIEHGQVFEIRILGAVTSDGRQCHVLSGYFDSIDKAADELVKVKAWKGCYFTPNPVDPTLLRRSTNRLKQAGNGSTTGDTNITSRVWLLIDLDFERASGISATDEEHNKAIERGVLIHEYLTEAGFCEPVCATSGNGLHMCYPIALPAKDNGLVKGCLQSLANRFDGDGVKVDLTVHNPSRIWKLYGTLACKGDSTPDRPHRMAKILSMPLAPQDILKDQEAVERQTVPAELLEALAAESSTAANANPTLPMPDTTATVQAVVGTSYSGNPFDVAAFIATNGLDVRGPNNWDSESGPGQRWPLNTSPMCEHDDGAAFVAQQGNGGPVAGCLHDHCTWAWQDLRAKYDTEYATRLAGGLGFSSSGNGSEPEPETPALEYRPFPTHALPYPLCEFVESGAAAIGCDASFIALPILTCCASAIGNTRQLQIKRGWKSGTAKSPAFALATRAVHRRYADAMETYVTRLAEHDKAMVDHDRKLAEWKKSKSMDEPPEAPEPPLMDRNHVSDVTVEALAPILLENPRGVVNLVDELGTWFASFGKYNGKAGGDASHWLSMHNGGPVTVDRKSNRTPLYIPCATVSLAGGIQPAILRRNLSMENRESGLAARLLLAWPPRIAKVWSENEIDPEIEKAVAEMLGDLQELRHVTDPDEEKPRARPFTVKLSPDAKKLWISFFKKHADEQAKLTGDLSAAWSKLEETAARLALTIYQIRATADPWAEADFVDAQSMADGITICEFFKYEALRIYRMIDESNEKQERRLFLDWIESQGGRVTIRQIQRGNQGCKTAGEAEAKLAPLVKLGIGVWEDSEATSEGGRPTRTFVLSQ